MEEILKILSKNGRTSIEEIAKRLDMQPEDVAGKIDQYEKDKVILGYQAVLNADKIEDNTVTGIIEVKLSPQRGTGFDAIAERIYKFPEVQLCYLISGDYDLLVIVEGKTLKDIAAFVSQRLSTQDHVHSTATHFILKKYKDFGTIMSDTEKQDRLAVAP
ncbi:MAG: Lrp/AsnC family transcriptional regulator [Candidatus Sumerlaeota bacterium]